MDHMEDNKNLSIAVYKPFNPNPYRLMNGSSIQQSSSSGWFEIRLFYVRITPCAVHTVPDHLTLRNLRREIGVSLEINGGRVPSADTASVTLRRDRVDKESSEVTYVSTDNVRVSGAIEFEVIEGEEMILCGSLERMETTWSGSENANGSSSGWSMDFYTANGGCSSFLQPKLGISSPSIEVYIAGCCSSAPVILTKTIQMSPRRRVSRHGMLDAIPEDEETDKEQMRENGFIRQRKLPISEEEADEYEVDGKVGPGFYSDEMYYGEDGQLSWFNAGVRVGVGIGLGMCLGVGIGVGLLMRSYQATTRSFRRRFF